MERTNLKPTHKVVERYYQALKEFESLGMSHESAVRSAFQSLLEDGLAGNLSPNKRTTQNYLMLTHVGESRRGTICGEIIAG
jgi:hypothetical protein